MHSRYSSGALLSASEVGGDEDEVTVGPSYDVAEDLGGTVWVDDTCE